jgi:nucleotide-binding universal stress UspA family protein
MRDDGPVIIAIDGSPHSARTLDWGVDEAARRGTSVVLVQTHLPPSEQAWGWSAAVDDTAVLAAAKEYLDAQEDLVRRRHPGVPLTARLVHGATVPTLRDESERAQLLVVGSGSRATGHRIGSVATHLAAHARCPVAVVKPVPHLPWTDDEDFTPPGVRPVVVGVDGSRASVQAAYAAADAAARRGVPLELVHARPTPAVPFGAEPAAVARLSDPDDPAHGAAQRVADALRDAYPRLDVRTTLVDDDPAHALTEASLHAQLLVVGSRGLGAFRGMLLGAVSGHVVRTSACTVIVLHDDEEG